MMCTLTFICFKLKLNQFISIVKGYDVKIQTLFLDLMVQRRIWWILHETIASVDGDSSQRQSIIVLPTQLLHSQRS